MAILQALDTVMGRAPLIALFILAPLLMPVFAYLFKSLRLHRALSEFPLVGAEAGNETKRRRFFFARAKFLYAQGYQEFKDGVFRITTTRQSPVLVVSPRFLPELQKLPDHVLSFIDAFEETLHEPYTQTRPKIRIVPHALNADLNPSLGQLNPAIHEVVAEAVGKGFPDCAEWTELNINDILLRVVATSAGRAFVGPQLCRSEQYLDSAINYTMDVWGAIGAIERIPPWKRFFLAPRLPEVKRLHQRVRDAGEFLRPVITARMNAEKPGSNEKADDMLRMLMDIEAKKYGRGDVDQFAKMELQLAFGAVRTTTMVATNAFYNLAVMPEVVPVLREEAQRVLAENGGIFTTAALNTMDKMDSFIRETMRMTPGVFSTWFRKALQPITLSNGQVVPAGVVIEVSSVGIYNDPTVYPDPRRFDAFRFVGKGHGDDAAKNQFTSVNPSHLTFGYGRHACPGRFLASNILKMILATILVEYDVRMVDDSQVRFVNQEFAIFSRPDPTKTLVFKKAGIC